MNRILSYEESEYLASNIEKADGKYNLNSDQKKLDYSCKGKILSSVSDAVLVKIHNIDTALDMWKYIQDTYKNKKHISDQQLCYNLLTKCLQKSNLEEMSKFIDQEMIRMKDIKMEKTFIACLMLSFKKPEHKNLIPELFRDKDLSLDKLMSTIDIVNDTSIGEIISVNAAQIVCDNCKKPGHNKQSCNRFCKHCKTEDHFTSNCKNILNKNISTYNFAIIDSGASHHCFKNTNGIISLKKLKLPDGKTYSLKNIGNMNFNNIQLNNVYSCPELSLNIISISQLAKNGYKIIFNNNECVIYKNNNIIYKTTEKNGLYYITQKNVENTIQINNFDIIHQRLGHISNQAIKNLNLKNIPKIQTISCETCSLSNLTYSNPNKKAKQVKKDNILDLIYLDLWYAPKEVKELSKYHYFISFTDSFSRYSILYFLESKNEVLDMFKLYKVKVENKHNRKIKSINMDFGGEFTSKVFIEYLDKNGIEYNIAPTNKHQFNGVAERLNRTLLNKIRALKNQCGISYSYWTYIAKYANLITNIINTKALKKNQNPYLLWHKKQPSTDLMRIFGCLAIAKKINTTNKLDNQGIRTIFIGISENFKSYNLLNLETKKIINRYVKEVKFDETIFPNLSFDNDDGDNEDNEENINDQKITSKPAPILIEIKEEKEEEEEVEEEVEDEEEEEEVEEKEEEEVEEEEVVEDKEIKDSYNKKLEHHSLLNNQQIAEKLKLLGYDTSTSKASDLRNLYEVEYINSKDFANINAMNISEDHYIPKNYFQAINCNERNHWIKAMEEEYNALLENNTWSLVDKVNQSNIINSIWIYSIKLDSSGNINRYKARLVANGKNQVNGIDYNETFSPVVSGTTIRLFIQMALSKNYKIIQMDVSTAFLNGTVDSTIYMSQPIGFQNGDNKICLLNKSLYGLKQAARIWYITLSEKLKEYGLKKSQNEPCLFYNNNIFVLVYVDDILITGTNTKVKHLQQYLNSQFKMKDLGNLNYYLNIHFDYINEGQILIHQEQYIKKLLNDYGMFDCNSVTTPIVNGDNEDSEEIDKTKYEEILGKLNYISRISRPDIAFTISRLYSYVKKPTKHNWSMIKRLLRYLKGTIKQGIIISKPSNNNEIKTYTDASFASKNDLLNNIKSMSGYIIFNNNTPISWKAKQQKSNALSTMEAEIYAATDGIKETIWIKRLLQEIYPDIKSNNIPIYIDNQAAIAFLNGNKRPIATSCHINRNKLSVDIIDYDSASTESIRRRLYIKEDLIDKDKIKLNRVSTNDNVADVFTKIQTKDKFLHFKKLIMPGE